MVFPSADWLAIGYTRHAVFDKQAPQSKAPLVAISSDWRRTGTMADLRTAKSMSVGLALGVGFGAAIGASTHDMGGWLGLGVAFGKDNQSARCALPDH